MLSFASYRSVYNSRFCNESKLPQGSQTSKEQQESDKYLELPRDTRIARSSEEIYQQVSFARDVQQKIKSYYNAFRGDQIKDRSLESFRGFIEGFRQFIRFLVDQHKVRLNIENIEIIVQIAQFLDWIIGEKIGLGSVGENQIAEEGSSGAITNAADLANSQGIEDDDSGKNFLKHINEEPKKI